MVTAVLTITLLTVVATLASWLFGQWLSQRARVSSVALAAGGGGAVLLIGSVAAVMMAASTQWQRFIPVQDSSPMITPAPVPAPRAETPRIEREPVSATQPEQYQADLASAPIVVAEPEPTWETKPAAESRRRARFDEPKERILTVAERHLERSEYAEAIDVARQYLTDQPQDPEMRSILARSLFAAEHPGAVAMIPAAVVAEWPATGCILSTRSDESSRWMLDNGCGRVVAVLFASCQLGETACFTNTLVTQGGWNYEPTGILMTAANDRPVPLRLGKSGPLVAPIFTIRDSASERRQIRYLACEITAPGVLQLLHTLAGDEQRLTDELRADTCYARVLDWTRSGQRQGRSPDALLRRGID